MPEKSSPIISIIMSVYNAENTLKEAIESIINQTYTNWEFVICDDASTDSSMQILENYKKRFPDRFIIIQNEKNLKIAASLNKCLEKCSGEFIARMDGDDISKPERLEKELDYLLSHPEYDLVGCSMQRFSDTGLANVVYAVDSPNYYTLRNRNPFYHATILTYKRVYDKLGGYADLERTQSTQDYDLWFRFYYAGLNGNNLKEPLYLVREDRASIRRRTIKVRWNTFKTTMYGFKLLNYPKIWIIKPAVIMTIKSLTPFKAIELYRKWQSKH